MQPMVRNAGEAMGVSALINLTDPGRGLFTSEVQVKTLAKIEKWIAWKSAKRNERVHGAEGAEMARGDPWTQSITHAPPEAGHFMTIYARVATCRRSARRRSGNSKAWLPPNSFNQRYLEMETKTITDLGTDPAQAEDMKNRKVVIPDSLGIITNEFGPALGQLVEKVVTHWYNAHNVPESERPELNGFRPNEIQDPLAYKMRPLNGVWATPPFIHNGAVPNVYALLSPVSERPKSFYLGRREYDPDLHGLPDYAIGGA